MIQKCILSIEIDDSFYDYHSFTNLHPTLSIKIILFALFYDVQFDNNNNKQLLNHQKRDTLYYEWLDDYPIHDKYGASAERKKNTFLVQPPIHHPQSRVEIFLSIPPTYFSPCWRNCFHCLPTLHEEWRAVPSLCLYSRRSAAVKGLQIICSSCGAVVAAFSLC